MIIVERKKFTSRQFLTFIENQKNSRWTDVGLMARRKSTCCSEIAEAFFTIKFNCRQCTECRVVRWESREMRVNRRRWLMLPVGTVGVGHSNEETWRNAGSLGEVVIYVAVVHTKRQQSIQNGRINGEMFVS